MVMLQHTKTTWHSKGEGVFIYGKMNTHSPDGGESGNGDVIKMSKTRFIALYMRWNFEKIAKRIFILKYTTSCFIYSVYYS